MERKLNMKVKPWFGFKEVEGFGRLPQGSMQDNHTEKLEIKWNLARIRVDSGSVANGKPVDKQVEQEIEIHLAGRREGRMESECWDD